MADAEEKARQEKIAAAKKRVEAMKKKNKKGGAKKAKAEASTDAAAAESTDAPATTDDAAPPSTTGEQVIIDADENEKAVDDTEDKADDASPPSLAQQSKLRSTSFRAGAGSGSPLSPTDGGSGDTAPEIYKKHVARIEELEKENKRLSKESTDAEKRWQKAEAELADLREAEGDGAKGGDEDTEKLKSEIASLQRQNTQLQQQVSRGSGHRASVSMASPPADLQAQIDSKSSTIESMELEISKLKARVESQESGATTEKEQVTQLEDKLAQAEAASSKAEQELSDLRSQLERATEKAVTEARTRASAEAKVESLEKEVSEAKAAKEALEKKVATLTTLHKEQDARSQALRKEVADSKARSEKLESENAKLRSRKSVEGGGGLDDEGVDELEDEERLRLEKKIRELEAEVHELRSGAWIEKRRELEATSPGFQDIDLSNNTHLGINANNIYNKRQSHSGGASGRIGDFFTNGLNALAGTGGGDDEGFLDDDDEDFDEAFRVAQEQETNRRLERIKDIKRSLKHWEGWRLDIVDMRRGGGVEGVGPIFDI